LISLVLRSGSDLLIPKLFPWDFQDSLDLDLFLLMVRFQKTFPDKLSFSGFLKTNKPGEKSHIITLLFPGK